MNIIGAKIDLCLNWDTDPQIEIEVDQIQSLEAHCFRYEERCGVYRAEDTEGFGSFFYWKGPDNNGGFGGRHIPIIMQDGSEVVLKGPWSSNSEAVNQQFPDRNPLIEVCLIVKTDQKDFNGQPYYQRFAGIATVKLCCALLHSMELSYIELMDYLLNKKLEACNKNPNYTNRTRLICQRIKELSNI